jgi:tRNA threonylcarbamoyladenosine biosynthesis protein TsaE
MSRPDPKPVAQRSAHLACAAATEALGCSLGAWIETERAPLAVYLSGELGSGKTTLARALLQRLGVAGRIKSPSYALVEPYVVELPPRDGFRESMSLYCYHFDFYRFNDPREWLDAGFRDYFDGSALCLVEWPEKVSASARLPLPDLHLTLAVGDATRHVAIDAFTTRGAACLSAVAFSPAA